MRLAITSILMFSLSGCGLKDPLDKIIEECMDACGSYADFSVGCGFELGASKEAYCEDECDGAEVAYDAGCENAYDALIDCKGSLNWTGAECSGEVIASKEAACAEKEAALAVCMSTAESGTGGGGGSSLDDCDAYAAYVCACDEESISSTDSTHI